MSDVHIAYSNSLPQRKRIGKGRMLGVVIRYCILIPFALAYIVPFFWLVSGSLKSSTELFATPPVWVPKTLHWENYAVALSQFPFFLYLRNTLTIVVSDILGTLISCSLAAYGFSRIPWKHRDTIFFIVLITMMLPFQVTMIPLFTMFSKLKWIGTLLPLIVPGFFAKSFFVFLFRQFFIGIPMDLSQSATIDGANEFQIYQKIIMPLSKPVIVTVVIYSFLNDWNDFIGPLIFLNDDKLYTLSLGIQQIMSENDPRWTLLLAAGVCMTLPVIMLFFLLQKYFIQGVTMTGIKE